MDEKIPIKLQNLLKLLSNPDLLIKPLDPRDKEYIEKRISYIISEIKNKKKTSSSPSNDKFSIDIIDSSTDHIKDYYELIRFVKSKYLTNIDVQTEYVYHENRKKQQELLSAKYGYKWKDLVGQARVKSITEEMQNLSAERNIIIEELENNKKKYEKMIGDIKNHIKQVNLLINGNETNQLNNINESNIENILRELQDKLKSKGYNPNLKTRIESMRKNRANIEKLRILSNQLMERNKELERQIESAKPQIGELNRSREQIMQERDGLARERDGLVRERDGLARERDVLRQENYDLNQALELNTNNILALRGDNQRLMEQNIASFRRIENLIEENRRNQEQIANAQLNDNRNADIIRQLQDRIANIIEQNNSLMDQYRNANSQNQKLAIEIKTIEDEKAELLKNIERLIREHNTQKQILGERINRPLEEIQALNNKLQDKIHDQDVLIQNQEKKLDEQRRIIQDLTKSLSECNKKLEQLEQFYSELQQKLGPNDENKELDLRKIKERLETLLASKEKYKQLYNDLMAENQKNILLIEELRKTIKEKDTKIDDLKDTIQVERQAHEEQERNYAEKQEEDQQIITQLHNKNEDLTNDLAYAEAKANVQARKEVEEEMDKLLNENRQLKRNQDNYARLFNQNLLELQKMKRENSDLLITIDQDRDIHEEEIKRLNELIRQLEGENKALKEQNASIELQTTARIIQGQNKKTQELNDENKKIVSELDENKRRLYEISQDRDRLRNLNQTLLTQIRQLRDEKTALEGRHQEITNSLTACQEQLLNCRQENQDLKQQNQSLSQQLQRGAEENKSLTEQLQRKAQENQRITQENEDLRRQLQDLNQQINNMQDQLARLEGEGKQLSDNDDYKGLMAEKNKLVSQLEDCQRELANQQAVFQLLEKQDSETQKINEQLIEKIDICSKNFKILKSKIIQFLQQHGHQSPNLNDLNATETNPADTQKVMVDVDKKIREIMDEIRRQHPQQDKKTIESIQDSLERLKRIMLSITKNDISDMLNVILYLTALYKGLYPVYLSLNGKPNSPVIERYLNHIIENITSSALKEGGLNELFIGPDRTANIITIINSQLEEYKGQLNSIRNDDRILSQIYKSIIELLMNVLNKIKEIKDLIGQSSILPEVIQIAQSNLSQLGELMESLGAANDVLRQQIASLEEKNQQLTAEAKDVTDLRRVNHELEFNLIKCERELAALKDNFNEIKKQAIIDEIVSLLTALYSDLIKNGGEYYQKQYEAKNFVIKIANLMFNDNTRYDMARDIVNQIRLNLKPEVRGGGGYNTPITINEFWKYGTYTLLIAIVILLIIYMIRLITRLNKKTQYPIIQEPIYIEC
jgi:chromosome segregation ATPase